MKLGAQLKWDFNKEGQIKFQEAFQKGGQGSFCRETFYKRLRKFNTNAKIYFCGNFMLNDSVTLNFGNLVCWKVETALWVACACC
jgi:hypothetical protein